MLRIWMGPANSGKSARVLEEIRRLGDSSFQLLLVPEHASHQAEVDLCRACGPTAARHSEVLSFRLLANRVLSLTGGLTDAALDPGGKLLMMQLALQEVLPQLTVYARPSRKAPFLGELVALFDEMEAYRVAPEQLGELYPNLEGISGQKLRDLSLIYAAYQSRLYQDGKDRRDLMAKLADNLEKSGYMDGRDVFLDGFSYFTAREEQIIAVMLRRAKSVTITLLGEGNSTLEIFRQGLRTRDRLVRLAQQAGAACTVEDLTAPEADTGLTYLAQQFFGSSGTPWAGNCDQAAVHRADSPFTDVTDRQTAQDVEVLRMLGARGSVCVQIAMTGSIALGLFAGVFGAALSLAGNVLINAIFRTVLRVPIAVAGLDLVAFFSVIALGSAVGALAAVVPSVWLARRSPIQMQPQKRA